MEKKKIKMGAERTKRNHCFQSDRWMKNARVKVEKRVNRMNRIPSASLARVVN